MIEVSLTGASHHEDDPADDRLIPTKPMVRAKRTMATKTHQTSMARTKATYWNSHSGTASANIATKT
jgi:hypothetical protein